MGEFVLHNASPSLSRLIQTVFNISSHYYSRVISTTTTPISDLPIPAVAACNMTLETMPPRYVHLGFNASITDLVVFVQLLPDTLGDYVALATACVSVRRPIYGYMNINPPEFEQTTLANFQSSLQIIVLVKPFRFTRPRTSWGLGASTSTASTPRPPAWRRCRSPACSGTSRGAPTWSART